MQETRRAAVQAELGVRQRENVGEYRDTVSARVLHHARGVAPPRQFNYVGMRRRRTQQE